MRNLLTLSNFVSIALLREIQPPDCWQQQHLFFRHILLLQVWDLTPKTCQVSLSMPGLNKTRPNMSADPPDPSASKMLGGQKHARFKTRVGNNKTWRVLFFQVPQAVFVFFCWPPQSPTFYRHLRWADHEIGKKHRKAVHRQQASNREKAPPPGAVRWAFWWCPAKCPKAPKPSWCAHNSNFTVRYWFEEHGAFWHFNMEVS